MIHNVGGTNSGTNPASPALMPTDSPATAARLSAELSEIVNKELKDDIEMLSNMLAQVVKAENPRVYDLYTQLRKHGIDRASDPNNTEAFQLMKKLSFDISPQDALGVMRVFSIALNLINSAEVHHKLRTMRKEEMRFSGGMMNNNNKNSTSAVAASWNIGPLPMVEDSARGTFDIILRDGVSKEEIYNKLIHQKVEIVITAHPTEVNRKTLLRKYRSISETLGVLDRTDLLPYERTVQLDKLYREIASTWGSDEIRRSKPTPQMEAAGGNAVVETVLWDAVPSYLRKLNAQCQISLGKTLPVDIVPIKFASWIGGDRDGNPNVTPEVTAEVLTAQRLRAAKLFLNDMNILYNELAISSQHSSFSPEMEELAASVKKSHDKYEKYRRVVGHLKLRLLKTIRQLERQLPSVSLTVQTVDVFTDDWDGIETINKKDDLMIPLKIMYDSLIDTGYASVADGNLVDTIRRLAVFGINLVPLDIREESTLHTLALDAVTQYLGIGSYASWNEDARLNFLKTELSNRRPLFKLNELAESGVDEKVMTTLRTFETISSFDPESLGAYVISQATSASDVLAVMLLQKQFGMTPENKKMMRVVPLFETLNDLQNAADILESLFQISQFVGAVKGKMEVMVGYSDSAKDAGRLAACWAQYTSQEKMVRVASEYNIELTFFHGKGGTVGRGGNPALYRAVLSHPPKTINGRFRVTEQGEMIRQNFGSADIAERTLDIYTAAVLREQFIKHVEPKKSWRLQMDRVSEVSCADYRQLVREEPLFVPYFRQATPELELSILNIGSRPAKRNPKGGIESLRAIPWTFAWAQTRLNLSAWLGAGAGLNSSNETDKIELKEMYESWPWFREIISLFSMILSKTDFSISANYEDLLVEKTPELTALGAHIRRKLVETRKAVLEVSGSSDFGGPHIQMLRATETIRSPYVDSINCVQAELLKELRQMSPEPSEIRKIREDALVVSINGIAQGMRNSG